MRNTLFLTVLAGAMVVGACSSKDDNKGTGGSTTTASSSGTTGGGGTTSSSGTAGGGGEAGQGGTGGAAAYPLCDAAQGACTEARWILCPKGTEPVDPNPHQDCPGESEGVQGWCCVHAPPSSCSDESDGNCVVGDKCQGCWGPVANYTCEQGRVCCTDICD